MNNFIISSTNPIAGSVGFALDNAIEIVFSDPVDESTISISSVILYRAPYDVIPVSLEYITARKTILVNPDADLLPGTAYTILVVGDIGGVRDVYGNDLSGGSYKISFTTSGYIPPPSGTYVVGGEYFIDVTGVWGTGLVILPSDGRFDGEWEPFYAPVDTTGLTLGQHRIYVHGQDNLDWGTMQDATFDVTNSGAVGTSIQTSYVANLKGPAVLSLVVFPSPTSGAPSVVLTGIITTRTFSAPPISAEYPSETATEYLAVLSIDPENGASAVAPERIKIKFNAALLDDFND